METLPLEVVALILRPISEYRPAWVVACRAWAALGKRPPLRDEDPLSFFELGLLGHEELLRWTISTYPVPELAKEAILVGAAQGGHENVMRLARNWGATRYNKALVAAASGGHEGPMCLAVEWGATKVDKALAAAAAGGHENAMHLIKEWDVSGFTDAVDHVEMTNNELNNALDNAAMGGHVGAMRLLEEWGANDFDFALACAKEGGHVDAMRLAKKWGAAMYEVD